MIFDIKIIETGNGGDLVFLKNDFEVVNGIENMPYLGMFGGNKAQTTPDAVDGDRKDWWANNLLMQADTSIQMNSITEKILDVVNLTSSGRVEIENAIKEDLKFLSDVATITVTVTIVATDRIDINLKIITDESNIKFIVIHLVRNGDGDWFIEDFNDDFNV